MKHTTLITLVLAAGLSYCGALWAETTITYQGRLDAGGQPHTGTVGMVFELYDQESGGSQQGPTLNESVEVTDGLFQAELDFGQQPYEAGRWLQITVNGQLLSPRQRITAAPVALYALAAPVGEVVLAHSTANLIPNSNVTPSSVTNFSPHSTVTGDGYAQLDLVGPMFLGGEEYGLASITYCIRGLSGGAFIAGVELADRSEVVAFDTTNRTEEGCYEFEVNLPGDAFGFALQAAGGGSLRINGVESVWKPVSELPTGGVQPPLPAGETSAFEEP